tara:strand:+ start:680 stop:1051 length:372 start_codon:yes stop_codon:yes gene_type:complete
MDYEFLLDLLVEQFGQEVAEKVAEKVKSLVSESAGWESLVVRVLADTIARHGKDGVVVGVDKIRGLLNSDRSDILIDFDDLVLASDALVLLQVQEGQKKSEVVNFAVKVGSTLSNLIVGAIGE